MACVGKDGWCYLLPTRNKCRVFDMECGGETESSVVDGTEELYIVMWSQLVSSHCPCKWTVMLSSLVAVFVSSPMARAVNVASLAVAVRQRA